MTTRTIQSRGFAIPAMKPGDIHVSIMNYVTAIQARAQGAADLRFIADSYQAAPGAFVLMVAEDTPIKKLAGVKRQADRRRRESERRHAHHGGHAKHGRPDRR